MLIAELIIYYSDDNAGSDYGSDYGIHNHKAACTCVEDNTRYGVIIILDDTVYAGMHECR